MHFMATLFRLVSSFITSPDPVIAPNTVLSRDVLVAPSAQCTDGAFVFRYGTADTLTVTIQAPNVARCTVYIPRTTPTAPFFAAQ
jgi:hypothetical protein